MPATAPDWLKQRDGELKESKDGHSWIVYLKKEPQYLVVGIPAGGKVGCRVTQSNNGHRYDCATTWATVPEALAGGLDVLRKALGW